MGWKAIGEPVVRRQRDRWVVRVDGIETETGKHRPRQLGTYPSQRAALAAVRTAVAEGRTGNERGTVGWLVRTWVESRTDISVSAQQQYAWALPHIEAGLGAIRLDRLDRTDIAAWLDDLATGGTLGRRSISVCRTALKAALNDAVDQQLLRRNPAVRVPMPREVAKPDPVREADAWDHEQVRRFLDATADHRWGGPFRLCVLYGLRRSELLALTWADVDLAAHTVRIDKGLVAVRGGTVLTNGKTRRSRRTIPIDPDTARALAAHRRRQNTEHLAAGELWEDHDLVVATDTGRPVIPRNFNHTLERLARATGLPRLSSHGLRHTAATHIVANAHDIAELRAAADILGHSPDMLLHTYAHTLPQALKTITQRIGERAS